MGALKARVIALAVLLATLGFAFALAVWPTSWRYDKITYDGDTYPVRINRFTGRAEILLPGDGWTPAEDAAPPDEGDQAPGHTES
jgi:hypothetical protein